MGHISGLLKFILDIFTIKGINIFHKIMLILFIFVISILTLLFIDNTFYFSKHIYNKNKLENIEKIYSLLENESISFEDKKYLNELKENIINKSKITDNIEIIFTKIIDNITKNMLYKHKEDSNENINIILYVISYSLPIVILSLIIIISAFYLIRKKELSLIGFILSLLLTVFSSLILIAGSYVIFEYIKYNTNIYKWNMNTYLKNIILSFIIYFIGFIIFAIIGLDLENNEKKNKKEIKTEESN